MAWIWRVDVFPDRILRGNWQWCVFQLYDTVHLPELTNLVAVPDPPPPHTHTLCS